MFLSDFALLLSIFTLIIICPYTKVEESFNMQAIHDLLEQGNLQNYDHLEFPGVVPRSFIGDVFIALVSFPVHLSLFFLGASKFYSQLFARFLLGLLCWISFVNFRKSVVHRYKSVRLGALLGLILAFQFHLPYYMSRTLPNTFAFIFTLNAFALWHQVGIPNRFKTNKSDLDYRAQRITVFMY